MWPSCDPLFLALTHSPVTIRSLITTAIDYIDVGVHVCGYALTVCVCVAGVKGDGPLVGVVVADALLRVPLRGRLVAVTRAVDAALVGVGHLYDP